jgi:predicted PurR-regulated permease PerM
MMPTFQEVQDFIAMVAHSDTPFLILFVLLFFFCGFIVTKLGKFISKAKQDYEGQLNFLSSTIKEELVRADKREQKLIKNLDRNTDQLENIAGTLKDIQHNFEMLEYKVDAHAHAIVQINTRLEERSK